MATINGTEINLMPTEGMRNAARRYREFKKQGRKGGTEVAARRATQILSGNELSPDVVIEMTYAPKHSCGSSANILNVDQTSLFSLFLNLNLLIKFFLVSK